MLANNTAISQVSDLSVSDTKTPTKTTHEHFKSLSRFSGLFATLLDSTKYRV